MWIGTDAGLYRDQTVESVFETAAIKHLTRDGDRVLAATDHEAWQYTDRWQRIATLPEDVRARWILPVKDRLYVGTSGAHVYRLVDDQFVRDDEFAHVPTRDEWHTPWGGPPSIWSACSNERDVWVNVHVGGIVHSDDAGSHWQQTPLPIKTDVHQVTRTSEGDLLIASARGYAKSADGTDWSFDNHGLHGHYLRAVTSTATSIFVTASHGPRSDEVAVYRRRKEASEFERTAPIDQWLDENIDAPAMASNSETIAFGTRDGRVFTSNNDGDDWTLVATDLPPVKSVLI